MSYEIYDTHGFLRQMKKTLLLTVSCPLCLTENIFGNLSAVLWKSILKLDSFFAAAYPRLASSGWCGPAWTLTFPIRAGRVSALPCPLLLLPYLMQIFIIQHIFEA